MVAELDQKRPEDGLALCGIELTCMRNLLSSSEERVYFKDTLSQFLLVSAGWLDAITPGSTPEEVIRELAAVVAPAAGLEVGMVAAAVIERERSMSTAFGKRLAVPHARFPGLQAPLVGIGIKARGIAFAAPDGEPVHLVVLLLTSTEDNGDQVALLADVAATFKGDEASAQVLAVRSFTEFLALVKALQGGADDQARAQRERRTAVTAPADARAGSGRDSG